MENRDMIEYLDTVCEGEEALYACERGLARLAELKEIKCEPPAEEFDADGLDGMEEPPIPVEGNWSVENTVSSVRCAMSSKPEAPWVPTNVKRMEDVSGGFLSYVFNSQGIESKIDRHNDDLRKHNDELQAYRQRAAVYSSQVDTVWNHRLQLLIAISDMMNQRKADHSCAQSYARSVAEHNEAIAEHKRRLAEYLNAQREYMKKYPELLKREYMWKQTVGGLERELNDTRARLRAQLDELYGRSLLHPRCRSMIAAFRLREYLRGGETLNGAYRRFSAELLAGQICESVQELQGARERLNGDMSQPMEQMTGVLEQLNAPVDALFEQIGRANEAVCASMQAVRDGDEDDVDKLGGELDALRRQIETGECLRTIRSRREHFDSRMA